MAKAAFSEDPVVFSYVCLHYAVLMKRSHGFLSLAAFCVASAGESSRPNVVIIFLDDAGHSDFRPFGDTAYLTPLLP